MSNRVGKLYVFSLTQPEKALAPTVPAASDIIVTVSSETQSKNALSLIVFKFSGRTMLSSDEQPAKALAPKVKELPSIGNVKSVKDAQPEKRPTQ